MQRKRAVKSIYVNFRFLKLHFRFEKLYVVVVQRKTKTCIKKYVARAELLLVESAMHVQSCFAHWAICCFDFLLEASKYALLGKISYKCFWLINPSILLNNLMLVTLTNLGWTVLRLILFFFGFTCVFSTVLRFLSEAPKANVSDATICKKVEKKSKFPLGIQVIIYRLLSNIYEHLRKLVKRAW